MSGRLACDSESCCERRASAVLEHSRGSGPRGALCVHKRAQKRSSARCAVAAVSPLRRGAGAPTRALEQRAALRAICCSWFLSGALDASCRRASARCSEQWAQGAQGPSERDEAPGLWPVLTQARSNSSTGLLQSVWGRPSKGRPSARAD